MFRSDRWIKRTETAISGGGHVDDDVRHASHRAHLLRMLAREGLITVPMQVSACVWLAWMMWDACHRTLVPWLLLMGVFLGIVAMGLWRCMRLGSCGIRHVRKVSAASLVGACIWGAFPLFTLRFANGDQQVVILLFMAGLMSGGALVFQSWPFAAAAWVLILLCCCVMAMRSTHFGHFAQIGVVSMLYGAILIRHVFMSSAHLFSRAKLAHDAQGMALSLECHAWVAEGTLNSVMLLDGVGRITWVNEGFVRASGFGVDEVLGSFPLPLVSASNRKSVAKAIFRSLHRQGQASAQALMRRKNGHVCWVRLDVRRMKGPGGQIDSYVIIGTDISDLKAMAESLRVEQVRQTRIIDGTHCGTWEIDFDWGVGKLGGHWRDIIGLDTHEPLVIDSVSIVERMHPDDRAGQHEAMLRYLRGQAPQYSHELRLRHEDGSWRWIQARGKASAYTASGRIEQMSGIALDISEAKAAERALMEAKRLAQQASEAKSMFLATMSHEIRTPMNGVVGTAEWLQMTALDDIQRDGLQTIVDSGRSLLGVIDDILDFSKVEAGRMKLVIEPLALIDLAEGVFDTLAPLAEARRVDMDLFVDPCLPRRIMGDAHRLRQVMLNLAGNAVKFCGMKEEGRGHIDVHILPGDKFPAQWRMVIADDGIGMSPQTLQNLFSPFTQADGSTTRRFGGTGLGLAISHRLVALMEGEIAVRSQPGQGAVFVVTLPMRCPDDTLAQPTDLGPQGRSPRAPMRFVGPGMGQLGRPHLGMAWAGGKQGTCLGRVLVAEDDEVNQKVIRRQLDILGFPCEIASDGLEAFALWRSGRFALLLSDLHMPGIDGHELARRIRAQEAADGLGRTPILALTANALKDEELHALACGMDACLTKPIALKALRHCLDAWFSPRADESMTGVLSGTAGACPRQTVLATGSFQPHTLSREFVK